MPDSGAGKAIADLLDIIEIIDRRARKIGDDRDVARLRHRLDKLRESGKVGYVVAGAAIEMVVATPAVEKVVARAAIEPVASPESFLGIRQLDVAALQFRRGRSGSGLQRDGLAVDDDLLHAVEAVDAVEARASLMRDDDDAARSS